MEGGEGGRKREIENGRGKTDCIKVPTRVWTGALILLMLEYIPKVRCVYKGT